jgi:Flp pilus assembly secretin CpaC
MKPSVLLLAAAALWTSAALAADPPMVTRVYPAQPSILEIVTTRADGVGTNRGDFVAMGSGGAPAIDARKDVKKLFGDLGVSFPPGSSISYNGMSSKILMTNTPENIEVFERALAALNIVPTQVEIDVSFVAFELKAVEEIARKSGSTAVSGEAIKALWREGKGRLVGTSKVLTRSGVNTQSKGVDEVIYPTEFMDHLETNGVATAPDPVPGGFETREIGIILNATPTVGPDGYTIDLVFVPEFCELLFHDDVGFEKTLPDGKKTSLQLHQPRFHSRNLTTSVVMWDGETLVAGAVPNSGVTEITYVFVTARVLDLTGRPVRQADQASGGRLASPANSEMEVRFYPASPSLLEVTSAGEAKADADRDDSAPNDMKKFFEGLGVPFPPGSSIVYNSTISQLILKNKPENLRLFEKAFGALNCMPNQVEIDMSFAAFDLASIEAIARKSGRAAVSDAEIKSLWREGKGRLVGTSKIVTRSGVNAQSKGVDEVLYPTEFVPSAGTNGVVMAAAPLPGSFETREIGIILNATPTVGPDSYTIDLTFVPEFCGLLFQDNVGFEKTLPDGKKTSLQLRQPRFHSRNLTTSVVMGDGETLVAGAMPNSGVTEITYGFITARLLDPSGRPVNAPDAGKDSPAPGAKPAK